MMQPAANMNDSPISPIEDILEDARNGKPYILVDAEDLGRPQTEVSGQRVGILGERPAGRRSGDRPGHRR